MSKEITSEEALPQAQEIAETELESVAGGITWITIPVSISVATMFMDDCNALNSINS